MLSKIVVIEPSYILRKGIVAFLKENFHDFTIVEESTSVISVLSTRERDALFLISFRIYLKNKELLANLKEQMVFLTYKRIDMPHVNYLKTSEEEFVATIEKALGTKGENQEDILTDSERNVLSQIALGLSNKEIANKLFVSVHTVTTHRKNITRKLDIKSVSGLTVYAIIHKLVSINDIQGESM